MPTIKKLTKLGNSRAVILDKALLDQLDIGPEGEVEISLQEQAIVIRPHLYASDEQVDKASRRIIRQRRKALKALAK